jgi:hypothetical protein
LNRLKVQIAAAALIMPAVFAPAMAAEQTALGSIWREGTTDKTVWIVGTFRSPADLDQMSATEAHPETQEGDQKKPLQESYFRFEAQCSDTDFSVGVKANAIPQERPVMQSESPYGFEDSPLREASIVVNGESSLNLHYLWGTISGVSTGAEQRLSLAGSVYRFLKQISLAPKSTIRIFTPKGTDTYLLDSSYQATANEDAIAAFKRQCAEAASNWH